jgi:acetyltransferase-like isoleucine patch superfamily enzyme
MLRSRVRRTLCTVLEVARGWVYLFALVTGGNFIRRAQLRSVGKRVKICPTAFFKYPDLIDIGDGTFINHLCSIWASPGGPIHIGSNVLLGPNVSIFSSNHGTASDDLISRQPGCDLPVYIGDDVWIGAHAVITAGVTIGSGVVVGAGAVVTRDLPPMAICAGVPARVIGHRSPHADPRAAAAALFKGSGQFSPVEF